MNEKIFATVISEKGVTNITFPMLASDMFRRHAVMLVKALSPDDYSTYKGLKFPNGKATVESRRAAYAFVLAKAAELALVHYVRIERPA